jgi:hypothetical protein
MTAEVRLGVPMSSGKQRESNGAGLLDLFFVPPTAIFTPFAGKFSCV